VLAAAVGVCSVPTSAGGPSGASRAALTRFEASEPHMGTTFRIVGYARSD